MRKPVEVRLAELEAREKALKARRKALAAQAKQNARKQRTHRLILTGVTMESLGIDTPERAERLK